MELRLINVKCKFYLISFGNDSPKKNPPLFFLFFFFFPIALGSKKAIFNLFEYDLDQEKEHNQNQNHNPIMYASSSSRCVKN